MQIGTTSPNYPFAAFQLLRSNQDALSTLFAYATAWELNLVAENQAEIADAQLVSGGFYAGLGVSPAAGRLIVDDDDRSGAAPVAVHQLPVLAEPLCRQPRRHRTANPDQQHSVHDRRSFRARVLRREPGSGSQDLPALARRPFAGGEPGR